MTLWRPIAFSLLALAAAGCTRHFWREQCDREVDGILTDKNCYERWRIGAYYLRPDPRSRFAEPQNDPDHPPMPLDDPAAKCLSPNPQKPGKAGCCNPDGWGYLELMAAWDAENRANLPATNEAAPSIATIAGPTSKNRVPYEKGLESKERPYLLNVDQAVDLALFNSREFQDRREDLYLAALPVTLERFAFATQFLVAEDVIREHTGSETIDGTGNRWRGNTTLGIHQLFPTGALLLVKLANQVVVNMAAAGTARVITPSTISFDFVQPLLRGGGYAVTLEPLTLAERNLLYEIRGYAHFRKEFFVAIAGGGPNSYGNNFIPGTTLSPSGVTLAEGYYPTILRSAILENQKENVLVLESILTLYKGYLEGGDVSQLQVDQVELELLDGRSAVLQQTQQLSDALDRFKAQLGVPTSLPIQLDDVPFRPLVEQQQRFLQIVTQYEDIRSIINRTDWPAEPDKLRDRLLQLARETPLVRGTRFVEEFPRRLAEFEALTDQQLTDMRKALKTEQLSLLKKQTDAQAAGKSIEFPLRLAEIERSVDLIALEESLRKYLAKPWERPGFDLRRLDSVRDTLYRDAVSNFIVVLGDARNQRVEKAREQWPALPQVCLDGANLISDDLDQSIAAISKSALSNRLDLMNARAKVVDAWRQIAVKANALMGVLNVRYHLDGATFLATQPFNFDAQQTTHQLILNGELPLVRQAERNDYRASLIAFQRSRRILQAAEDAVLTQVRSDLRQLRFLAENYKIQQRAVELSYYQVENALNTLKAPPRVVPAAQASSTAGGGSDTSGNQAALTRQLLDAVSTLLRAQNGLYSVYQSYLVTRLQLYRDVELMQLDNCGVWIDDVNHCCPAKPPVAAGSEPIAKPATLPESIIVAPSTSK
jgi:hypothetical protein